MKSSQLPYVLLPKSLYFLLATSAAVITKVAKFSQLEDRAKNIIFRFKFYFKNIYISSYHAIFSLQENSVPKYYENPSKAMFIKGVYYLSLNQLIHVAKPYKVLGTQNPFQVQNRIYNLKIKLDLKAFALRETSVFLDQTN